jgi:multiple sugar transport system ATP-binding protein
MTLGQRVAVMRDGRVQQVDAPQRLYDEPANLFVAAFIGSPAMNLAKAQLEGDAVTLGGFRIPLNHDRRPTGSTNGEVIVGIRPEAFEDAAFAEQGLPTIDVEVTVLEELGADDHVFFRLDADPVVVEETRTDEAEEATLMADTEQALFTARVDPRTTARVGSRITLAVDPARLYFFSPDSGESLLSQQAAVAA